MTKQIQQTLQTEERKEQRPLFRQEAVEHHARGLIAGQRTLDLTNRTTTFAFRVLLAVLAVAIFLAFTVETDESTQGEAVVSGRQAQVLVPIGALGRLKAGQLVRIEVGGRTVEGSVVAIGAPVAGPPAAVPLTASLSDDPDVGSGAKVEAVVRLERHSIAAMLLPRLKSLFGQARNE